MRTTCGTILAAAVAVCGVGLARPIPRPALAERLAEDSGVRVERMYRPARYERGMLNQHVCQPIDEAAWIWHPDVKEPQQGCFDIGAFFMSETGAGNEARPAFVRFRRVFSSDGSPFEIDVSADERFVLFLDGKCIARGPNRGWTENWQYQTYTVAVPAGEHAMEAVVMHLGAVAPITQMSCRGGFVLKASGGYDAKLTTGKAQWQAGLLRGTTMGSEFVGHGGMGCRATSTGVGFEDEVPSEWKDAVVVARPIRPKPSRFNWGLRRPGWMLYPSEMPDQTDVERRPGAFRTGPKELSSLLSGGKAVIPAGTTFTAYWDLEDYYCYYPELVMSGGRGARVRVSYAEALVDADGKKGDRSAFEGMKVDQRFHMYDTFVADGRANARFTSPWWRCGRWIVLDVSTGGEPLALESLSIRETRYPCEMESVFQSPDDPTFEAIQRICLRSIQNCAHETLMDCPFYEQQMYPADTRVQMLVLTALSDDDRLIRRCIDIYDLGRRDDGLVPNNWPTRNFQESQVMSLNYLMMYGDFVRWHRNDEWLKARFPGAMNTLLAMKRQENSEGLLEDVLGSPFIDWVGEWGADPIPVGRGEGPGAIVNLYYLHAMKSVADMADAVGEPDIAAHWRKRADELGRRIVEKFWDADKGLMADDVGHTKFSEHAQCFAILADVLGEAEAKAAFGHLTDGTELARVTVYSLHYLFETFAKFGRGDLILGRFGLWRDYLKAGLKTCLETPVGYKYQRSDCHGWGSHPIYHLRASIAGIRPAAPGFARVRISPSPGNLRNIRSTMPHPSGTPVEVDLGFDGEGGVSGVVKSPVDGEFVWNGQSVPVIAGRETNVEIKGAFHGGGDHVWIEAEAFSDYGKWRLDTQFTHKMGSAYLIAPGVCEPIGAASTTAILPRKGLWRVWVRTKDWLPAFSPGRFAVTVGGRQSRVLGASRKEGWVWECAGEFSLEAGPVKLSLDDLSGAFARCDALLLATDLAYTPPSDDAALAAERDRLTGVPVEVGDSGFYDVVVVGAGPAGVNAALAAARGGAKVALIGDRPVLGGNASDEIGVNMCGAAVCHAAARETGIAEEAVCVRVRHPGPGMSNSYRALVEGEKNLSVFYNERMIAADASAGCVKSVVSRNTLTGVRSRFSGRLFVDATGDGWLGYFAGAEYRERREGMREFNESCAPEEPDGLTMSGLLHEPGIGVCYRATKTDGPVLYETPAWAQVLPPGFERKVYDLRGQWWIEHSGLFDDCADPERARDELIRISFAYWGWLKNASSHSESARNYRLDEIPVLTGRRESRRLVGDYILTANDCLKGQVFPDAVAYGGWPIDTHDPMGMSAPKSDGYWKFHPDVPIYTIPFRCLYSKNVGNLMMAGRDISGSHMAMGSARVQQTCSVVGQAAGTAAALCVRHGLSPRELGVRKISELQQRLLRDDAYIPGFANEDPLDHAREAVATASSSAGSYRRLSPHGRGYASAAEIVYTNASPAAVVDGVSRCVDGVAHAWVSGPGLPQWIRLDFPVAVTASEIRVTFDTNLEHRALPRPPDPALARSYAIEGSADGKAWFPIANETDNYRRLRVHRFEPRQLKSVRLVVRGTYGADQAFVNEIRVY